ncbi:Protein of unknown function [Methylomagnum ishizawai]|uniref:DUF1003 domain-containing protein n=1 Tax=Methylomagnum ishizawai TaxID=1760988 RepID=A0A1Y6D4X3_9GAMM|nr:DUF1003 domain-containing protein [Methylomagnum ishizawai]SMF97631.1 Protein of unknown function [Methylomagnum ishizawai]
MPIETARSAADLGTILCPACGGENPADAIFCGNHSCHKALGEFRYVLEELRAARHWIEHLADRVSEFAGRPQFIALHVFWFAALIAANSGRVAWLGVFDAYPYSLLGIMLSVEAILVTGFLLISQNRQHAYAHMRAELDYELNIRCYRKLLELERRLDALVAAHPPSPPRTPL